MLEAARAQAYWAHDQAYWARAGVWVQAAAFAAAGAAAWFTWKAAKHARIQADAATTQLANYGLAREAESRVAAWAMVSFLSSSIRLHYRNVQTAEELPEALTSLARISHQGLA